MLKPHALLLAGCLMPGLSQPGFATGSFPVTLENCGSTVTLDAAPERIFVVNADDFALLWELDALDRVVARTADPLENVHNEEIHAVLSDIPLIATERGATGGSVISLEVILSTEPDLVLAPESAVDRQLLADAGIAMYSMPAYCEDTALIPGGTANFERVYEQLETFGLMLGEAELAAERTDARKAEVASLATAEDGQRTAFALYVAAGGKTLYPYGARSMVTPVFAAAGLTNVYADIDDRVFEAGTEELFGKNPDVIVLLYSDASPDNVLASFNSVPGVENFAAVQNGRIVPLPFLFTDPPSPLSIKGAVALAEKLSTLP
ncbi:ABC transporter substrate-binding protein [Pelagibacterium lentulum]|uniref:ABC transporter substrate-binding protein n=1 Tax=Pelagibacterium lentulum TaxID=2029865 RepID=A0A916RA12_9HYPH|nr:ABC transporter substrate-binding protein [Pelagibacterium lentulum]GGA40607.1 ABC transporter substrate-binding protein [Pelagibacterium lentulum]